MYDVVALGELLVDFTQNGLSEQENILFEANPGGAPCNVLAMLAKLGKKTAFLGKVGADGLGKRLREIIVGAGIDASALQMDDRVNTTLAFVHSMPNGDRDFSFYRNPGADMMLEADEVDEKLLTKTRVFHFGTLSMTHEGVRQASKKALDVAEKGGALISFDPNLREPLWDSLDHAKEQMAYGFSHCHILKIADNEIVTFTGLSDYDEGVAFLQERFGIPLILLTMGAKGSRAYYQGMRVEKEGFVVDSIETTGAGDAFCGCALSYLLEHDWEHLSQLQLEEMLTFANAGAALVTEKKGALRSMPEKEEILALMGKTKESF